MSRRAVRYIHGSPPGQNRAASNAVLQGVVEAMQVLCQVSNTASDVRCPVCGQGFLVYWTRSSAVERAERRQEIVQSLREHHIADQTVRAHPQTGFHLPEWDGEPHVSAAALLGGAPKLATA